MSNKLEQNRKIIADAPDGATHHAQGMHYLALNKSNDWMRYDPNGFANAKWFNANDFKFSYAKSFRSLDDIRENIALQERIAELEKRLSNAETMGAKAQAERDLEQQADALEKYGNNTIFPSMGDGFSGGYCSGFEAALSKAVTDAKKLREQTIY